VHAPQGDNTPAQIGVTCAESEAVIDVVSGEIVTGALPRKALRLTQAWVELRRDELLADWALAASGELPYKIAPL
jgi:hypothetical protein